MANYRQIHVSIWKDEWFLDLEPQDKLLFIYLFSNENTSLSGIYKLPIRVIAFETGLDTKYISDALTRFSKAGKVYYESGVVWVVNMRRYHETKSGKVQQRINADIAMIPDCPLKIQYLYSIDTETQLKEKEDEDEKEDEEEVKPKPPIASTVPLAEQFTKDTGITELSFYPDDFAALAEAVEKGVEPADFHSAWMILSKKGFTISGPKSLVKTAISEMGKRKTGGGAPPGYNGRAQSVPFAGEWVS